MRCQKTLGSGRIIPLIFVLGALTFASSSVNAQSEENQTTVQPHAISGPLTNPGIGVASFHDGYGERLPHSRYPDTGIEYQRFYWSDLEPVEGQYNFALVDNAAADAYS